MKDIQERLREELRKAMAEERDCEEAWGEMAPAAKRIQDAWASAGLRCERLRGALEKLFPGEPLLPDEPIPAEILERAQALGPVVNGWTGERAGNG